VMMEWKRVHQSVDGMVLGWVSSRELERVVVWVKMTDTCMVA